VASNLSCVGLGVADASELDSLVDRVLPRAVEIGRLGDLRVLRWEDPSGARLVLGVSSGALNDLLPTFAGVPRTALRGLTMANHDVAVAAVVDDTGEQLTSAAIEIEERRILPPHGSGDYRAALVALGVDVSVFASAEAFEESDASLLSGEDSGSPPPDHFVEQGWQWPPRIAASSFISYGVFGDEAHASAHARLSGIVAGAERRVVQETGQAFIAAVASTAGFDVTVCLADGAVMPKPGGVISGTVFLTASLDGVAPAASTRRRRLLRRRRHS
jgi:hypothetical protein